MSKLKPCPFCGGKAKIIECKENINIGGSVIECSKCMASSHVEFGFKENLKSSWNTRANEAEIRNKALEEAAKAMKPILRSMISRIDAYEQINALKTKGDSDDQYK